MATYPPELGKSEFNCAHCGVFAAQVWYIAAGRQGNWRNDQGGPQPHSLPSPHGGTRHFAIEPFNTTKLGMKVGMSVGGKAQSIPPGENDLLLHDFYVSVCFHCGAPSIWRLDRMLFPSLSGVDAPNPDMRQDIREDYREAASVLQSSPRAAVALLRLCVQKLCEQLGQPGKNINDDIAQLVVKGLNPEIQRALDTVRVIGNNAVHPLEMDLKDDLPTAQALFGLVNYIAEQMISFPAKRAAIFATLPDGARKGIEQRDGA